MACGIEEFVKTATKEQKDVLFKIFKLGEQEQKLANEVNKIRDSVKSGIYSDGYGITVCEDADDVAVISAGPREKLENVRREIKNYMLKAVKLGMGDLGFIERNYEHYVGEPLPYKR